MRSCTRCSGIDRRYRNALFDGEPWVIVTKADAGVDEDKGKVIFTPTSTFDALPIADSFEDTCIAQKPTAAKKRKGLKVQWEGLEEQDRKGLETCRCPPCIRANETLLHIYRKKAARQYARTCKRLDAEEEQEEKRRLENLKYLEHLLIMHHYLPYPSFDIDEGDEVKYQEVYDAVERYIAVYYAVVKSEGAKMAILNEKCKDSLLVAQRLMMR